MTKIEWCDEVWNPVTGCTKVSAGCKNCYAERMAKRLKGRFGYPADDPFRVTCHPERLHLPLNWNKPRRVFVNSMSDLFHEEVPFQFIDSVFVYMKMTEWHKFMILTKRPERMHQWFTRWTIGGWDTPGIIQHDAKTIFGADKTSSNMVWPLPNVWLGISAEDQKTTNERIPWLISTPAAKRFISLEPLLGPVSLIEAIGEPEEEDWEFVNYMDDESEPEELIEECEAECDWINYGNDLVVNPEYTEHIQWRKWRARLQKLERSIDWVIVGGESGPGAREMKTEWGENIFQECQYANIPIFVKQMGSVWAKENADPNSKGGSMNLWPELIRVRKFPEAADD